MSDQLPLDLSEQPKAWRSSALKSFHVRCHQHVEEALEGDRKARDQEGRIAALFRERPDERLTPSEVLGLYCAAWPAVPVTSVRRAMTNLSDPRRYNPPVLVHWPGERRPGPYGRMESCWSLRGGTTI